MPNSVLQQVLSCFGLDCLNDPHDNRQAPIAYNTTQNYSPVQANYALPTTRPTYVPGSNYTISELSQFASSNLPSAVNRPQFLSDLLKAIVLPDTNKSNKATLCKHLAQLMTDQEILECHGAPRQANYFASYCVDLTLQVLEHQYSATMEEDLRDVLMLWKDTLCEGQTEFNLNGVVYSRTELDNMLRNPNLISRQLQQAPTALAHQWERRLHGEGTSSRFQTVHDQAVQNNGSRVLNIMKAKHGQTTELSHETAKRFIKKAAATNHASPSILAGMNLCLTNTNRDNNWNVNITPQKAIKEVIQYIKSVPDHTMRTNLTNSLLERLREIDEEGPCVSGVLQRLIDVPNGIDPDMSFAGVSRQIGEEMATLAGKTYEQFNELIDEGMEAIVNEEHNPDVTQTIASSIGRNMFDTRVNQDMKILGGLDEETLAPHRERLKAGFD